MNRRMTEEQAKKTYERALKMEHEFGEYFTGKWTFFGANMVMVDQSFKKLKELKSMGSKKQVIYRYQFFNFIVLLAL